MAVTQLYGTYKDIRDTDWYVVFDDSGKFKEDLILKRKNHWLKEVAVMKKLYKK